MGCGALCGDIATADTIINQRSKQAMQALLSQLKENRELTQTQTYSSFFKDYQQQPWQFQLNYRKKLVQNEQITQAIKTKWKLVLFGLDKHDQTYCKCIGLPTNEQNKNSINDEEQQAKITNELIYHKQFVQIQKDLQRTFSVFNVNIGEKQKKCFENVLKRITNHFPKMGYTQGINFFISYLLVIGYSQQDSFDIFVHMATNKRYLLLGFYQEDFPLSMAILSMFENMLKRINGQLYSHIYQKVKLKNDLWIYKWLTAFYISKFPKELIKHIMELVILKGCFGLVIIAVSLLSQLQSVILQIQDFGDLYQLFETLIDIEQFNKYINLRELMEQAYRTELILSDFDNIEEKGGFYGSFIKTQFQIHFCTKRYPHTNTQEEKHAKLCQYAESLLMNWQRQLINDRIIFIVTKQKQNKAIAQIQVYEVVEQVDEASHQRQITQLRKDNNENQEVVIFQIDKPLPMISTSDMSVTRNNSESTKSDARFNPLKKFQYLCNRINENIDEQQLSVSSSKSKVQQNTHKDHVQIDALDKFEQEFDSINRRQSNAAIVRTRFNHPQRQKPARTQPNIIVNCNNSLSLAGQVSMKNDTAFDIISVSSRQTSRQENKKQDDQLFQKSTSRISRACGCKTKTEENRLSSRKSQMSESKDQFSDKDFESIKNYSQNSLNINDSQSIKNRQTQRERVSSQLDFMINSHGPIAINQNGHMNLDRLQANRVQNDIQVMICTFKKNKRARINLASPAVLSKQQSIDIIQSIKWQPDSQSLSSIQHMQQRSHANNNDIESKNTYEIESIR